MIYFKNIGHFLLLFLFCGCLSCNANKSDDTLRKRIGRMVMVGFRGITIAEDAPIVTMLNNDQIGGVVLFDYDAPSKSRPRNIVSVAQTKTLCHALQAYTNHNIIIAIDQEGGYVSRLKERYGFPPTKSAQSITASGSLDTSRFYAHQTAQLLKEMGFTLNFAPVVDLNTNPTCPVIGKIERSYGVDATTVVKQATIVMEELQKEGLKSCLKHFPGHGSATMDSHLGFTDVSESWNKTELAPYKALISSGLCDAVMTGHLFNSKIDSLYPATLSQQTITGILREELGWEGVVFSDDMAMGAITQNYNMKTAIKEAINAGVDVLIFSNNGFAYDPEIGTKAVEIILELVRSGEISEERINQSYERISAFVE